MTEEKKDIIIANPMYDVVFKTLMQENLDFARYFVGTILGVEIVDIIFAPTERTYPKEVKTGDIIQKIKVIRLDFVATIRTKEGDEKKVLIEIKQTEKPLNELRFSGYICKHYIERNLEVKGEEKKEEDVKTLPIVVIHLLGYKMPSNPNIAVSIDRSGKKVKIKEQIVEILTHDIVFIQVSRIRRSMYRNWDKCSELMKLLSLFEQNYFVDKKHTKKYHYNINPETDKILYKMIKSLERIADDPYIRSIMDDQEIDEMELNLLKNTNTSLKNTVVTLQAQLAEYQQRFGILTPSPN